MVVSPSSDIEVLHSLLTKDFAVCLQENIRRQSLSVTVGNPFRIRLCSSMALSVSHCISARCSALIEGLEDKARSFIGLYAIQYHFLRDCSERVKSQQNTTALIDLNNKFNAILIKLISSFLVSLDTRFRSSSKTGIK